MSCASAFVNICLFGADSGALLVLPTGRLSVCSVVSCYSLQHCAAVPECNRVRTRQEHVNRDVCAEISTFIGALIVSYLVLTRAGQLILAATQMLDGAAQSC